MGYGRILDMETPFRLSNEDFAYIYSKVPRFNVDLVVRTEGGIVLIKRSIEPHIGCYHVPGGTLYKGETFNDAAVRVAKNETGFDVEVVRILGAMEFPAEKRGDLIIHTVSVVLEVKVIGGELRKDNNAKEIGIFTTLPEPGISEHYTFLREHKIFD
jgi:colanic acid biosynthesis protein WcaH